MNGCRRYEYYDAVIGDCYPCNNLCQRGLQARDICKRLCPDYFREIVVSSTQDITTTLTLEQRSQDIQVTEEKVADARSILVLSFTIACALILVIILTTLAGYCTWKTKFWKSKHFASNVKWNLKVRLRSNERYSCKDPHSEELQQFVVAPNGKLQNAQESATAREELLHTVDEEHNEEEANSEKTKMRQIDIIPSTRPLVAVVHNERRSEQCHEPMHRKEPQMYHPERQVNPSTDKEHNQFEGPSLYLDDVSIGPEAIDSNINYTKKLSKSNSQSNSDFSIDLELQQDLPIELDLDENRDNHSPGPPEISNNYHYRLSSAIISNLPGVQIRDNNNWASLPTPINSINKDKSNEKEQPASMHDMILRSIYWRDPNTDKQPQEVETNDCETSLKSNLPEIDTPLKNRGVQEIPPGSETETSLHSSLHASVQRTEAASSIGARNMVKDSGYGSERCNDEFDPKALEIKVHQQIKLMERSRRMTTSQVYTYLNGLEECRIYCFDDGKLEIQVDFNKTNYISIINTLCKVTGWAELDFRIKEYRKTEYTLYGLIPGHRVKNNFTQTTNQHITASIGAFVSIQGETGVYALSVAHVFKLGQKCFLEENFYIGKCVEVIKSDTGPVSLDLAIIKLKDNHPFVDNTIFSSKGIPCTFRFPANKQEIYDMELWKVQRKADGNWQYGYFRHSFYTNKDHNIYGARTVVNAHELCPFIREGECGSLVTTLPRDGKLTVYGMLNGCVRQEADDGGDMLELYTAFPLEAALSRSTLFQDKELQFYPANGHHA